MPITVAKTAGAGSGSDTTLTITGFSNLTTEMDNPADSIADVAGNEDNAILIKMLGPSMRIGFDWVAMPENSSVVSGAGGSVTTAPGQYKYLYDTLASKGTDQILDEYTLTIDFGGGVTLVRTGVITKINATMTQEQPVTFNCHMDFLVGDVF